MQSSNAEGDIPFAINFTDSVGLSGDPVSETTNSSNVIFDKTAPILDYVHIESNNANNTLIAITGDDVFLTFRPINTDPIITDSTIVTIGGQAASLTQNGDDYIATMTINGAIPGGFLTYTIDFMDRARLLCSLGQTVLISNFKEYYKLVEYFSQYTKNRMGLSMGVSNLVDVFDEKYYRHLSGGILEAFGKLFFKDLRVYLYPMLEKDGSLVTSDNLKVHPRMKELYKFFKYNGKVVDITDYDKDNLTIFSREVLKMISNGEKGWEKMLPKGIANLIKEKSLFGFESEEVMHKFNE